ncbi:hypothetical protein SKAU_G00430030 [Synaphobranchus kaupii]|uniref:Uncharacterized protein n=1 Tax=Synaphobranchus kaupii TaxID=118154 RepID=A0A9Q1E4C9_SYNKA|nr:hypothetical protein SKAU_G00430030 [Synaphobranchus kaupii]
MGLAFSFKNKPPIGPEPSDLGSFTPIHVRSWQAEIAADWPARVERGGPTVGACCSFAAERGSGGASARLLPRRRVLPMRPQGWSDNRQVGTLICSF